MNRILDDERSRLSQSSADDLMMLSLNGPDVEHFDFFRAVMTWHTAAPRREQLSEAFVAQWKANPTGMPKDKTVSTILP